MQVKARLGWIRMYRQLGDAGVVCRRCGISRPTLRKWWRRFQQDGEAGLTTRSCRPHRSPSLRLALDTIHKVLVRHSENLLQRPRLRRKGSKRYSWPVPGDRVQVDVCKITAGVYQYTAIDDCSRWQVAGVFPRKTATNTVSFPQVGARGHAVPHSANSDRSRARVLRL